MARVKINLLGKKKTESANPIFEKLTKVGVRSEDIDKVKPGLIRLGILLIGLYFANFIPNYLQQMKIKKLDDQINALSSKLEVAKAELSKKKEIRKQMEQLNKEEIELQRQLNAVNGLRQNRGTAFRALDKLVNTLPKTVWLSSMAYKAGRISLNGSSWEYFPINDFVKSINETAQFFAVNYKGIKSDAVKSKIPGIPEADQKIKNFDLEFSVHGAE